MEGCRQHKEGTLRITYLALFPVAKSMKKQDLFRNQTGFNSLSIFQNGSLYDIFN